MMEEAAPEDPFANFLDSSAVEPAVATSVPAVEAAVLPPETIQRLYSISWMIAPAIVFLIATGVGAWSLQLSETNLENFVKAGDFKACDGQMRQLAMLEKSQKLLDRMSNRQSDYDI